MSLWEGHRTAWVRIQFCVGVLNAYAMVGAIARGSAWVAAIFALSMLVTAQWRLPPPGDDQQPGRRS